MIDVCRTTAIALLLLPLALWAGGCSSGSAGSPINDSQASSPTELRAHVGEFHDTFLLSGELEAVTGHPVSTPHVPSWRVPIRWLLDDGSIVSEGDKIIELDTTEVIGNLEQKQIAEVEALSEIEQKKADIAITLADRQFDAERSRIALEKAEMEASVPTDLLDRRKHQEFQLAAEQARVQYEKKQQNLATYLETSERELEIIVIGLDKARREIERAETAMEQMELRAPRSGILVISDHPWEGRKFQVGDSVWVGLELAKIPDLSIMRVNAMLSDVDDGKIAPGMRVVCTLDAYPQKQFPGVIQQIAPMAREDGRDSLRRFFKVLVDLDRSDPDIMRPGMSVRVEVETASRQDVLLVPRAALSFDGDTPRVRLPDGTLQDIRIGECNALECEVLSGLSGETRLRASN